MPKPEYNDEFDRLTKLLADRGFVKRVGYDSAKGVAAAEWTESGLMLQTLLRRLFDVRDIDGLRQLSDSTIADLIYVVLATKPFGNRR